MCFSIERTARRKIQSARLRKRPERSDPATVQIDCAFIGHLNRASIASKLCDRMIHEIQDASLSVGQLDRARIGQDTQRTTLTSSQRQATVIRQGCLARIECERFHAITVCLGLDFNRRVCGVVSLEDTTVMRSHKDARRRTGFDDETSSIRQRHLPLVVGNQVNASGLTARHCHLSGIFENNRIRAMQAFCNVIDAGRNAALNGKVTQRLILNRDIAAVNGKTINAVGGERRILLTANND